MKSQSDGYLIVTMVIINYSIDHSTFINTFIGSSGVCFIAKMWCILYDCSVIFMRGEGWRRGEERKGVAREELVPLFTIQAFLLVLNLKYLCQQ